MEGIDCTGNRRIESPNRRWWSRPESNTSKTWLLLPVSWRIWGSGIAGAQELPSGSCSVTAGTMEEKLLNRGYSFCPGHYPSRLRGRKLSWLFSSLPPSLLPVLLSSQTSRIPENKGLRKYDLDKGREGAGSRSESKLANGRDRLCHVAIEVTESLGSYVCFVFLTNPSEVLCLYSCLYTQKGLTTCVDFHFTHCKTIVQRK